MWYVWFGWSWLHCSPLIGGRRVITSDRHHLSDCQTPKISGGDSAPSVSFFFLNNFIFVDSFNYAELHGATRNKTNQMI